MIGYFLVFRNAVSVFHFLDRFALCFAFDKINLLTLLKYFLNMVLLEECFRVILGVCPFVTGLISINSGLQPICETGGLCKLHHRHSSIEGFAGYFRRS